MREEEIGHTNRYDAYVGNAHFRAEGFDGLADFLAAPIRRVSLAIAMDEQKIARISVEGELDFLVEAFRNLTTP